MDSTGTRGRRLPASRSRLPRRLLTAVAIATIVGLGVAVAVRSPSPIGHWDSAAGRTQYLEHYEETFADLPEPDRTIDVRTDFGVVRVYRFDGTADREEPIMLLPGTASGSPTLSDNVPSLQEVGDVYLIDLLGEPGLSIQERPITSDADKAAWLDQTLAELPEERFHLVGFSIGGWTAMNAARHTPERIASVSTLDAINTYDTIPLGTAVRSIPANVSWLPKSWRDSFNSYTAGGYEVEDVPVAEMIESGMKHYRMVQPQPTPFTPEQLGQIDVPVLAIIAGRSVMHDPPTAERTAKEALPEGRVVVFPDASHAVNGEYPQEVADEIGTFLDGIEP